MDRNDHGGKREADNEPSWRARLAGKGQDERLTHLWKDKIAGNVMQKAANVSD